MWTWRQGLVGEGLVRWDDGAVELTAATAVAALRVRFCWARRRLLSSTDSSPADTGVSPPAALQPEMDYNLWLIIE